MSEISCDYEKEGKHNYIFLFKKENVCDVHVMSRMLWFRRPLFQSPYSSRLGFLKAEFLCYWLGLKVYVTNFVSQVNLKFFHWWTYHFFPRLWIQKIKLCGGKTNGAKGSKRQQWKWNPSSALHCRLSLDTTSPDTCTYWYCQHIPAAVLNPYFLLESLSSDSQSMHKNYLE